jgi:hypothetical protein
LPSGSADAGYLRGTFNLRYRLPIMVHLAFAAAVSAPPTRGMRKRPMRGKRQNGRRLAASGSAHIICCTIAALAVCCSATVHADQLESASVLRLAQAKSIVATYLKSQGYDVKSKHFELDSKASNANLSEYFLFYAYYDTLTRLNSIGSYAVNKRTAELWERLSCQRVSSQPLAQLQNALRGRLDLQRSAPGEPVNPCF